MVELGGIGPVPFACGLLADLGATVVRVERNTPTGLPGGLERLGVRNRVHVALDFKDPADRDIAAALIAGADAVVEGFRPGVAERLGLGPETMRQANPGLIYVRITGWGQEGPYSSMAGHDINYIGLSGVLNAIGSDGPVPPLNLVGDYAGGALFGVIGLLAALVARQHDGVGDTIDAAMVDGSSVLLGPIRDLANAGVWGDQRSSNLLDGGAPFYRAYETSDGKFMAVGALEPRFFEELLNGLGVDAIDIPDRNDPANWPELTTVFEAIFRTRTRDEWASTFERTDACVTPILSITETASHSHASVRRAFTLTDAGPIAAPAPRFASVTAETPAGLAASDTLMAFGLDPDVVEHLVRDEKVESALGTVRAERPGVEPATNGEAG